MSEREVSKLIAELKELKLRELEVLSSLQTIVQGQQVQQATVHPLATIETIIQGQQVTDHTPLYEVGDLVYINNKIRRPLHRNVNRDDRLAVVTKVAYNRIDVQTNNGTHTWRSPKNLKHRL
jgi:hypothetical protein